MLYLAHGITLLPGSVKVLHCIGATTSHRDFRHTGHESELDHHAWNVHPVLQAYRAIATYSTGLCPHQEFKVRG